MARVEAVGAYTLLVLRNDGGEVGAPGQFFMLQADPEPSGAYLPRALSAAWADAAEIAFLLDVRGAGTARAGRGRAGVRAGAAGPRLRVARRACASWSAAASARPSCPGWCATCPAR